MGSFFYMHELGFLNKKYKNFYDFCNLFDRSRKFTLVKIFYPLNEKIKCVEFLYEACKWFCPMQSL